jgi:retinol dehydrogenase 12
VEFAQRSMHAPAVLPLRLGRSILRQRTLTPTCPDTPRLDGKVAVVTGGNAGIGLEISRGLAQRGAEVVIAARNQATAEAARETLAHTTKATVRTVALDLTDLRSVVASVDALGDRKVDILVANAGIWPNAYSQSAQGHEIAFAVNTLGHYVFVRRMQERSLLAKSRVVMLTGDIYIRANDCTSDFKFAGPSGGAIAYCRSKLGNLWLAAELQRRYPELEVCAVHPGVVDTNLTGEARGIGAIVRRHLLIDSKAGAQTPLICATQPIERGAYYHNTMGRVSFPPRDPAADSTRAAAFWDRLEQLSAQWHSQGAAS